MNAAQRYEDVKSSASAFHLIESAITVFAVLCWIGVVSLNLMMHLVLTVMNLGCLVIGLKNSVSTKAMVPKIAEEIYRKLFDEA